MGKAHTPERILLIQLDHLGDAVLSLPMVGLIKQRWPGATVDVVTDPAHGDLWRTTAVDTVFTLSPNRFSRPDSRGWLSALIRCGLGLRRRRYDLGVDIRGDSGDALLLCLAGVPVRLGWTAGGRWRLLTHRAQRMAGRAEWQSRRVLLATYDAAFAGMQWPLDGHLSVPAAVCEAVRGRCAALPGNGPLIVVHPGAGTPAKRWPGEQWATLLAALLHRPDIRIVMVGGTQEQALAQALVPAGGSPRLVDWTGRLNLLELAALCAEAALFIGGDSGPAHVAGAVGTPSIVLFSGTNRVSSWKPPGDHVQVMRHAVRCAPCGHGECPVEGHPCMTGITTGAVESRVAELLGRVAWTPDESLPRPA